MAEYNYQSYITDERFPGQNEIYRNMDQNMNYRGSNPFGNFNSGVGSFYNPNFYQQNVGTQPFPHRGFEEMQFNETVQAPEKKGFNFPNFGFTGILSAVADRFKRPEAKQRAYDAITGGRSLPAGGFTRGTYGGNEFELYNSPSGLKVGSDILGFGEGYEKNFDSMFGSQSLEEMEQKKIDWAMSRLERGKAISQRLRNALKNRGLLGDKPTEGPIKTRTTTNITSPNVHGGNEAPTARHDYTRDRGGGYTLGGGFTGTRGEVGRTGSRAGEGRGHHSWRAEGGRVGLKWGGDPEIEQDDLSTMEFMQDQGIPYGEMASAPDPMDALNDMSMNIYGKPLHELTPDEYQILIDLANDQAAAPAEGLASIV